MTTSQLLDIARRVAGASRPDEQVEAYVTRVQETDVEVFGGDVESLTTAGIEGIGVRVIADHRQGYASAGSLDLDVVDETLQEARDNASFGEPDEWYGLASPDDVDGIVPVDLDLWRDEVVALPTETKVQLALDLEAATKSRDARVRGVEAAGYGDARSESAIVNSNGVEAYTRRTRCSAYAVALADDGRGTQTGYGFAAGRSLADLDLDAIPRDAVDRAVRLLGAQPVAGRRIPVVFDPLVTRALLGVLSSAFNGEMLLKGRSLFAGRDGEEIAAPIVELVDDPTDARAFGASTHDSEGMPTRPNVLITGGVLHGFLHNTYTGRRAGGSTTGSAVRGGYTRRRASGCVHSHCDRGHGRPRSSWGRCRRRSTCSRSAGCTPGRTRSAATSRLVPRVCSFASGSFTDPVREVTIASTLQRILLDITEVGADITYLPGAAAGVTLLVGEMTLSGV